MFETWETYRGVIRSHKGGWRIGHSVQSHGYSLLDELVGEVSLMQVMIMNATGRLPERRLADWFEARQICLSWPDPRIWCNQIGALGGNLRASVAAATAAGIMASDSRSYGGPRTSVEGVRFIKHAMQLHQSGMSAGEIVEDASQRRNGKPGLMGYARPIAKGDERIPAMQRVTRQLGFHEGEHMQLAYAIDAVMQADYSEGMNINGYASAFFADQGLLDYEVGRISAVLVASGVTACYVDSVERPVESFYPLHCVDVDYTGPALRSSPRCQSADSARQIAE